MKLNSACAWPAVVAGLYLVFTPLGLASRAKAVDYTRDIKPLLAEKCAACHGALQQESGLRLDHGSLIRTGGDSGSILDADDPGASELLLRVTTADRDLRMPPEGQGEALNAEQLALLTQWIARGAPSPEDEEIPAPPEAHWAWQPPVAAAVPEVDAADGSQHPIDRFLAAGYREQGLLPLPLADPEVRLRRLVFDLTGLPPTADQRAEFLRDHSPAAWQQMVDRLLDAPAYGERWARHWMDVWRYSDWEGYKQELRSSQRHIWRWRDWIVTSLNQDKGYDQMLVEMLAGDELAPLDRDVLAATGYLARNYHKSNRNIWLDATVEHTAKAFLGLTLDCARCHDHKFDPIPQSEYYAFRAIFEPHQVRTERVAGEHDLLRDGLVRAYDADLDEPTYVYLAGNDKMPDREHPVAPSVPHIVGVDFEVAPVSLPPQAVFPALAEFIETEDLQRAAAQVQQAEQAVRELPARASHLQRLVAQQTVHTRQAEFASLQARWAADRAKYAPPALADLATDSCDPANPTQPLGVQDQARLAAEAEHQARLQAARLTLYQKQQALSAALLASLADTSSPPSAASAGASGKPAGAKAASGEAGGDSPVAAAQKQVDEARQALAKAQQPLAEDAEYTAVGPAYPATSSGRRLALARWITDRRNPLTARVAINHLWRHYFGQPLVENVFDFGLRSPLPQHHALLDWLAVQLMEHNWSLKHVQRLIVTSRAYQLASHTSDAARLSHNLQIDRDNRFYWRADVRRLDAEAVRDSLLAVGGQLDRTLGGPDIDFEQGESVLRRSLYFRHAYEKQMTMLVIFDAAGPQECYRRSESIIPQQALALANSPLAIDQARLAAHRLWGQAAAACPTAANSLPEQSDESGKTDRPLTEHFVQAAFECLLGRACTADELRLSLEFLRSQSDLLADPSRLHVLPGEATGATQPAADAAARARENFVHVLMNHNDFVSLR